MYNVRWKESAQQELAANWLAADSSRRSQMTRIVDQIDRDLAVALEDEGESREGILRILLRPPVGIYFEVWNAERRVEVLRIWQYSKRSKS